MRRLATLLALTVASTASAQEAPQDLPPDLWMDPMMRRSWDVGEARPFISSMIDAGYLYLRPRVSFGYGRPFTQWVGVDVNPIASSNYLGIYSGLRVEIPHLNWRAGVRYLAAFVHHDLDPMDSYDRVALEATDNGGARTVTLESEVETGFRLGPGDVIALGSVSYVTNVPNGLNVFEESLRVIVDPPWVLRGRAGYLFRWGARNQHSVGLVVDTLDVPARNDGLTVRAGLLIKVVLSRRVEVRGSFVPTIISPDTIGIAGSDFTELGIRYRWATE